MRNFFIVGVQKAGTTALHAFLSRHPQIRMSDRKELHFFDDDHLNWSRPDYTQFERHFKDAGDRIRGEATPIYTYWPKSLSRLKAYDPEARLIMLLRHPTFRAYSHWKMETRRNAETLSFAGAIKPEGRQRVRSSQGGVHRIFSYVERGFYAQQIERLLDLFPRSQVLFLCTDDLWLEPQYTLAKVEAFLCIETHIVGAQEYIILASTDHPSALETEARLYLDALFAPDIREAERLTNLNLSEWLSPNYTEPEKVK